MAPMPTQDRGVSNGGVRYMAVCAVLCGLSQIAVTLRVIARRKHFQRLALDDWTVVGAQVLAFCLLAEAVVFAKVGGIGWPFATLPTAQATKFFKISFVLGITYALICPLVKISILLLYTRVFSSRLLRIASLVTGGLCVAWGMAVLLATIFQCSPIHAYWDTATAGRCVNRQSFFLGSRISNILLNFTVLCLPIPLVMRLPLSRVRRFAMNAIFILGGLVCVASIMRIVALGKLNEIDISASLPASAIWSTVEPCLGIIVASLPILAQLFTRPANQITYYAEGSRECGSGTSSSSGISDKLDRKAGLSDSEKDANIGVALTNWKGETNESYSQAPSPMNSRRKPSNVDWKVQQYSARPSDEVERVVYITKQLEVTTTSVKLHGPLNI